MTSISIQKVPLPVHPPAPSPLATVGEVSPAAPVKEGQMAGLGARIHQAIPAPGVFVPLGVRYRGQVKGSEVGISLILF